MRRALTAVLVLSLSGTLWAQPVAPVETKRASFKLAFAGLLTIVGGMALVATGGETYYLPDNDYCVSGNTIERGACQPVWDSAMAKKASLITMAAGGTMLYVGLRKVKVTAAPQVGHGVVGATATVKW